MRSKDLLVNPSELFSSRSYFVVSVLIALLNSTSAAFASSGWQKSLEQGDNQLSQQNVSSAEYCFRQAVKEIEGAPHTTDDMVKCLNKLANVLALQHKTDAASAVYQRSLKITEQVYGRTSPKTVKVLLALGSIHEAIGDHNSAMRLYQRVMDITESDYGPYDPAVACGLKHLGQESETNLNQRRIPSSLSEQPGLEASQRLLHKVDNHSKDLLTEQENSNESLIADFQREMQRPPVEASALGNLLSQSR